MNRTPVGGKLGFAGSAVVFAAGLCIGVPVGGAVAQEVTYADDVAPIIYENCAQCHRPGSFAPMSLLTYEDAQQWAPLIKYRVQERLMPPWHIDKTVGIQDYRNDISLSDEEIQTLVQWVDSGSPRGSGAIPPLPEFPDGDEWQLEGEYGRPPDVVVRSTPYTVMANGQDQWWEPSVEFTGLEEPRWIQAYEFKPSYPNGMKVVHHGHASVVQSDRVVGIAHYGVGKGYEVFPEDTGMLLEPGGSVRWNLHYAPISEQVEDDVVEVGLWFYPEEEEPRFATEGEVLMRVDRMGGMPRAGDLLIPPHGYKTLQGAHVLEEAALISSIRPHMHTRGKEMSVEAIFPDGRREVLAKVDNYKHVWQITYMFAEEAQPLLPRGTVLLFSSVFDNTAENDLNPDPDQWVVFGRRGVDEMSHMWVGITYLEDQEYEELREERSRDGQNVAQRGL